MLWGGMVSFVWADATVVDHKESRKRITREKDSVETHPLEERIRHLEKDEQELNSVRLEIVQKLDEVNHQINQRQLRVSLISQEILELTDKIKIVEREQQAVKSAIEKNKAYVNERLCALHRIKGTGCWQLFSKPRSLFDFWERQQALTLIIRSDVALLENQTASLNALEKTTLLLEGETGEKKLLDGYLALEIENLEKERKKRQELLDGVREKRALTLAAMDSARKALEENMQALKTHAPASVSGGSIAKSKRPVPGQSDKGLFLSRRGSLHMPVNGRILSKFGTPARSDDNTFTFQTGIDIRADRGEPVRSVFRGDVLYADWLKGYGNLIIINHGDNYYTLYAHMEEIFKKKGDVVEDREVIATTGDTGSVRGPSLHFEVRHHGKPVDPLQWLKKGA